MRKEEDCKQSEKFLQAVMQFSDKTIKAWKAVTKERCKIKDELYHKFINWERQQNEVAIFTTYAYADFSIPKKFDCIFSYDNPEIFIKINFTLNQSIWEGWFPCDSIENGHKHLCIFTFENIVPDILTKLHLETKKYSNWSWDAKNVLGICQVTDIQSIIDRRHKEIKLKEQYGENWYDFDDET